MDPLIYILVMLIIWLVGMILSRKEKNDYDDTGIKVFLIGIAWPLVLIIIVGVILGASLEAGIKRLNRITL